MKLDKPSYKPGDTIRLHIAAPAAGKGYAMVESSEGPLWWQEISVPAEGKTFELPIDKKWARHDLYLSALVIRPGERKAQVTPKRAVGLLHLPLERAPRKLALSLEAPEKMRPKQPLKVKVSARNADGSIPDTVHVLVAAVDVGILNITSYATPDPFANFFGRKAYGADQLDIYGQLIEAQGRVASLAFGGDAGLAAGGKRPDTSVLIVALDGEERGLLGAREFVKAPPVPLSSLSLNLNFDMTARAETDGHLWVTGTYQHPNLRPVLEAVAPNGAVSFAFGKDTPQDTGENNWVDASDHGAFNEAGVPFLYMGVDYHPDYHRPSDTFDRITPSVFTSATEIAIAGFRALDQALDR